MIFDAQPGTRSYLTEGDTHLDYLTRKRFSHCHDRGRGKSYTGALKMSALKSISVRVLANNDRAIAWYRTGGFVEEGRERVSA
jgi:ribosomal protein S18 acetylase RimI-like enzyme